MNISFQSTEPQPFSTRTGTEKDSQAPEDTTDPRLNITRRLLKELYGVESGQEAEVPTARQNVDTLQLSSEGVSLMETSRTTLRQETAEGTFTLSMEEVRMLNIQSSVTTETTMKDPLVVDLQGDGVGLRSLENGVTFDIDGDGKAEKTGWVDNNDAFLVLDRNENGIIDNGREFFGDQHGAANGFEELARFDDNRDGRIDALDKIYDALKLWQDRNGNGTSESDELLSLKDHSITEVSLKETSTKEANEGNHIAARSTYQRQGKELQGGVSEVWFRTMG